GNIILLEKKEAPPAPSAAPSPPQPQNTPVLPTPPAPTPPAPTPPPDLKDKPGPKSQTTLESNSTRSSEPAESAPSEWASLEYPLQGVLSLRLGQLRAAPSPEARVVALLRQGDELEILTFGSNFFQ